MWSSGLRALFLYLAAMPALLAREYAPLLTGEVFSRTAQQIFAPHTPKWRVSISLMAPEGQLVQPGDVVVAFDGTETQRQLEQHREQRRSEEALAARDLARLEMETTEARFVADQARIARELAVMKARIPRGLIGELEYSEYQLAIERAERALQNALDQFAEKQQNLAARQQQAELERQKADLAERWWQEQLQRLTIAATQSGYVIHANHRESGAKFQEGDIVRTSFRVAEVADTTDLAIRVWVNAADRPHIEAGTPVRVTFDALPELAWQGRLESLSDSATKRRDWSDAAYYEGTVRIEGEQPSKLLPGMSAMVEVIR